MIILYNGGLKTYKDVDFEFVNDTLVKITGVVVAYKVDEYGGTSSNDYDTISHTFFVPISRVHSISIYDYDPDKYEVNTP